MDACHTARLSLCCSPSLCSPGSSFAPSHPSSCGAGMSRQGNRVTEAVPLLSWVFASTLTGGFLRGISLNSVIVKSRSMKQKRKHSLLVKGAAGPNDGVRWWEKKGPPNMHDISSTQDFVNALGDAGEKLVVVEFFGSWCGSCRALYPKCLGPSMLPTFNVSGDILLMELFSAKFEKIKPGDVVMARSPINPRLMVCKRVTGLEGDHVMVTPTSGYGYHKQIVIPKGHVWLQGDNLSVSRDSRDYGSVPYALIQGRVFFRIRPPKGFGPVERHAP